jgi:hypothetical protein
MPEDEGGLLASQANDPRDESIGGLVKRLVEDGKAYARAEIDVLRQVARHRARRAKAGAGLLGIGIVFLLCALQALVLALVLGLATLIGPFGAGMAIFAVFALVGLLAARAGAKGLAALGGDGEEDAALARAEKQL